MSKSASQELDVRLIKQIQQQQIEINILKQCLDDAARDRLESGDQAKARSDAMTIVLDSLIDSLRPYGFNRKQFVTKVRKSAGTIPSEGPGSLQHGVLLEITNKILATKKR